MPKIKGITENVKATGEIPSRRLQVRGEQLGSGTAIRRLGQKGINASLEFTKIGILSKDQEGRTEVTKAATDGIITYGIATDAWRQATQNSALDDEDLVPNSLEAVDKLFDEKDDQFTTPKGQAKWNFLKTQYKQRLKNDFKKEEQVRLGVHAKNQSEQALTTLGNDILTTPIMLEPSLVAMEDLINDPDGQWAKLPAKTRDAFIKEKRGDFHYNFLDGLSRQKGGPAVAKEILDGGKFDKELDKADRRSLGTLIESRIRGEETDRRRVIADAKTAQSDQYKATSKKHLQLARDNKLTQKIIDESGLPVFGPDSITSSTRLLDARTQDRLEQLKPIEDFGAIAEVRERIGLPIGDPRRIDSMEIPNSLYQAGRMTWEIHKDIEKMIDERDESGLGEQVMNEYTKFTAQRKNAIEQNNLYLGSGDNRGPIEYGRMQTDLMRKLKDAQKRGIDPMRLMTGGVNDPEYLGEDWLRQFQIGRQESRTERLRNRNIERPQIDQEGGPAPDLPTSEAAAKAREARESLQHKEGETQEQYLERRLKAKDPRK